MQRLALLILIAARFASAENGLLEIDISRDIHISGEDSYPTPYILSNLGALDLQSDEHRNVYRTQSDQAVAYPQDEKNPPKYSLLKATLKEKEILSLGEGYSGLVPYLRSLGANAQGVDLAYDKESNDYKKSAPMRVYLEKYSKHLKAGDATRLDYKQDSFDLVLSHMVFPYIPNDKKARFLGEAFRVTRPKGEVRIATVLFLRHVSGKSKAEKFATLGAQVAELMTESGISSDAYDLILLHGTSEVKPKTDAPYLPSDAFTQKELEDLLALSAEKQTDSTRVLSSIEVLTIIIRKK